MFLDIRYKMENSIIHAPTTNLDYTNHILYLFERNHLLNLIVYTIFFRISFMIFLYVSVFYPISFYSHIICFIVSYTQEQILFMLGHMALHMNFNYVNFDKMGVFCKTAYVHHYFDSLIFPKINFYNYCTIYLTSSSSTNNLLLNDKYSISKTQFVIITMFFFVPWKYIVIYLSLLTSNLGLTRLTIFCIHIYLMKLYNIDNLYIIYFLLYVNFNIYLQALTHLWYHTLETKKRSHFGTFLFYIMCFLENINIVSSETHKLHHNHRIHNLTEVEVWNDLYVPSFINSLFDIIFQSFIKLNIKNANKLLLFRIFKGMFNVITLVVFTYIVILSFSIPGK